MTSQTSDPVEWILLDFSPITKAKILVRCGSRSATWHLNQKQIEDCIQRFGELPALIEARNAYEKQSP